MDSEPTTTPISAQSAMRERPTCHRCCWINNSSFLAGHQVDRSPAAAAAITNNTTVTLCWSSLIPSDRWHRRGFCCYMCRRTIIPLCLVSLFVDSRVASHVHHAYVTLGVYSRLMMDRFKPGDYRHHLKLSLRKENMWKKEKVYINSHLIKFYVDIAYTDFSPRRVLMPLRPSSRLLAIESNTHFVIEKDDWGRVGGYQFHFYSIA